MNIKDTRNYVIVGLVITLVIYIKVNGNKSILIEKLKAKIESGEALEEDLKQKITLKDNEIVKLTRTKDGKVTRESTYIPPEGKVITKIRDIKEVSKKVKDIAGRYNEAISKLKSKGNKDNLNEEITKLNEEFNKDISDIINIMPDVKIKDSGFAFRLGLGLVYSDELIPEIDIKFLFWKRYSTKMGFTPQYVDVGLSRHIDDITPSFLQLNNLEIQILMLLRYTELGKGKFNPRFGIGLRTNL